jgi:hypothetical protein
MKANKREAEKRCGFFLQSLGEIKNRRKKMKIAGLVIGIVLMILSGIGIVICLLAPSMTNGRASFEESMLVAIPLGVLFLMALAATVASAIMVFKARKSAPVS